METIHQEAARYGIEQPQLERYQHVDASGTTIISLTPDSEARWSSYLRSITLAKIALNS